MKKYGLSGLVALVAVAVALFSGSAGGHALVRCHTGDLSGRLGFIDAGAGSRFGPLVLKNRSRHTCTLFGYIGGQLYNAAGRPIRTSIVRDHSVPEHTVVVAPGRRRSPRRARRRSRGARRGRSARTSSSGSTVGKAPGG